MIRTGMHEDDDPFYAQLAPPADESHEQKEIRLAQEAQAKSRSDAIDQELHREQISRNKNKTIKLLLLGQSESGKSTTLKNFQLMNSSQAFRSERHSWRAIIQLNVVRSIRLILNIVNAVEARQLNPESPTPLSPRRDHPPLTAEHLELRNRLTSLLQLEDLIWRNLAQDGTKALDGTHVSTAPGPGTNMPGERFVNSTSHWQATVGHLFNRSGSDDDREEDIVEQSPEISETLRQHVPDMDTLWQDTTIQAITRTHGLSLKHLPGFFLDSLERVTAPNYVPTDDDILRARLKTLGVSEHKFTFRTGDLLSHEWRVFDVGGARSARAAWVPYFQDVDSIIFLAPLSPFDQMLAEDPKVNRLEDSMILWKKVVSHQLLKRAHIILFLNKTDLFREKLEAGVMFSEWVTSFGDRPNTFEEVSGYMIKKFGASLKRYSPEPRPFYCHLTSVTDVETTAKLLDNVRHLILRRILEDSKLM